MELTERHLYDKIYLSVNIIGPLTSSDIINFFSLMRDGKHICINRNFTNEGIKMMNFDSNDNRIRLEKLLHEINNGTKEILANSWERGVIYNICILYGYTYQRIDRHDFKLIGCNEFRDPSVEICGCKYAPRRFHKYHYDNNYDDTIAYSKMPWTYKIGVRINPT